MAAETAEAQSRVRYTKGKYLGAGTFSRVYSATDTATGLPVALKKVLNAKSSEGVAIPAYAEVRALMELRHPNIVQLHDVFPRKRRLCLAMELCETDLETLLASPSIAKPLPLRDVKMIMVQLLKAVAHCHAAGFLHQDIKPGNMLISPSGAIKLADFGLAVKVDSKNPRLHHQVVTLIYRPPELVMGARRHGAGVDLWSCGCVLAELLLGKHLFGSATSELRLLFAVIGMLGAPSLKKWPGMALLPSYMEFGDAPAKPWADIIPGAPAEALDLLSKLMVYNPEARLAADAALRHPFLADVDAEPAAEPSFMAPLRAGLRDPPPS